VLRSQPPQNFEAVEARQTDVQHEQVERQCGGFVQSDLPVMDDAYVMTGFNQGGGNFLRQRHIIFDNENAHATWAVRY
jgi:hypothetical protein